MNATATVAGIPLVYSCGHWLEVRSVICNPPLHYRQAAMEKVTALHCCALKPKTTSIVA